MKLFKSIICLTVALCIMTNVLYFGVGEVSAKNQTKQVVIWKMNNKKMKYRKSIMVSKYLGKNAGWENIIGYGRLKKSRISSKAKFYLLDLYSSKLKLVSRSAFKKMANNYGAKRYKERGKVYYWGMACKITIKNGKIIKIKQVYQS